jgi:hypothetical protein
MIPATHGVLSGAAICGLGFIRFYDDRVTGVVAQSS